MPDRDRKFRSAFSKRLMERSGVKSEDIIESEPADRCGI